MSRTVDAVPQCGYVTPALRLIKASMSTTNSQAAKSCVAMVTAELATHLTPRQTSNEIPSQKATPLHSPGLCRRHHCLSWAP